LALLDFEVAGEGETSFDLYDKVIFWSNLFVKILIGSIVATFAFS